MSSAALKGSCACGRVRYSAAALPSGVQNCHCVVCRKLSGGPFIAFATFRTEDVQFYDGEETVDFAGSELKDTGALHVFSISDQALRAACRHCHAPVLMYYHARPETTYLTVGTIDDSELPAEASQRLKPAYQIFVGQKAPWYDADKDGIPCYDRFDNDPNVV
ncbi:hypothetical protein MBLNU459_g3724t1 [Dothideomycetes sp. NU459]